MVKITFKELKEGEEEKSHWLINAYPLSYLSVPLAWFFMRFLPFITPNQISFIWGFISLVGIFMIGLGGYFNMVIGILIYQFAILLDYVDGIIARVTKNTTIGGTYLDIVISWINRSLLVFALGVGIYNTSGNIIYAYIGLWTGFLFMADNLAKLKVYESLIEEDRLDIIQKEKDKIARIVEKKNNKGIIRYLKKLIPEMLRPFTPISLFFFAIIFNLSEAYLILITILVSVFCVKNFVGIYKKIGNIPTNKHELNRQIKEKQKKEKEDD